MTTEAKAAAERIDLAQFVGHTPGEWIVATSNSWRRICTTDGKLICDPIVYSERDRHPDLHFRNGGEDEHVLKVKGVTQWSRAKGRG